MRAVGIEPTTCGLTVLPRGCRPVSANRVLPGQGRFYMSACPSGFGRYRIFCDHGVTTGVPARTSMTNDSVTSAAQPGRSTRAPHDRFTRCHIERGGHVAELSRTRVRAAARLLSALQKFSPPAERPNLVANRLSHKPARAQAPTSLDRRRHHGNQHCLAPYLLNA